MPAYPPLTAQPNTRNDIEHWLLQLGIRPDDFISLTLHATAIHDTDTVLQVVVAARDGGGDQFTIDGKDPATEIHWLPVRALPYITPDTLAEAQTAAQAAY